MARDITRLLLRYGYWASYNLPYFDAIIEESGNGLKAKENDWWSWKSTPRARMFARDVQKVHDMQSLKELMRFDLIIFDDDCILLDNSAISCIQPSPFIFADLKFQILSPS